MKVQAVLTDIEGTTSSIDFVHKVLFPYAKRKLPEFVLKNSECEDIATLLDEARQEAGESAASTNRVIEILLDWIEKDRKVTPLKALQGHVWRQGYENGDFTGHIYDDVAPCLRRWSGSGIKLYVYSSGSVSAQKLLFGYSDAGDLQPLFNGYFDTRIGQKKEVGSYHRIAESIGKDSSQILFLSDVTEELDAARTAGLQTFQLVRDSRITTGSHYTAGNFDAVIIDR